MKYSLKEISLLTGAKVIGDENEILEQIIFDSRLIFSTKKTAFIALKTKKNTGEKYISEAIQKGIKTIISEKKPECLQQELYNSVNWILCSDTNDFLRILAKKHLENLNLKTIGITGSNGKTIIKEWLYQCLWDKINSVKSPKSFNSQIGLPLSILQAGKTDELGIFEVGISLPKEMQKQSEIFLPKIGIFTYLGTAHSEYFENEEELLQEKLKLFEKSETIIFNGDNLLVKNTIRNIFKNKKLISYGQNPYNDIFLEIPKLQNESLNIKFKNKPDLQIHFSRRDTASMCNILAVIAVLDLLKIPHNEIAKRVSELKAVEMRMESVIGERGNLIIDDSYNLDLDSLKIALNNLSQYGSKQRKILVLTDIIDVKFPKEILYKRVSNMVNEHSFNKIYLIGKEITNFVNLFRSENFTFKDTTELSKDQNFRNLENSLILLKGARKFKLENIKKQLELLSHDTILEINLSSVIKNINIHKNFLKPSTKIMAMVKAYSYGLGGYEIAEFLQHHKIDYFGVAYADEGVELRKNKISHPIMVMNPELNSYDTIIEYKLEPEIYNLKVLDLFINTLKTRRIKEKYSIHIKLETGMHRLGFRGEELDDLLEKIKLNNINIASIFTHLSSADDFGERNYTLEQMKIFKENSDYIINNIDYNPIRHCLNSSGITNYPEYQFDMVRIGIGMMGYSANPKIKPLLSDVVCFKSVVTHIFPLKKGESLGYNRKFIAKENTNIATISVGYADGIPRIIGNGKGQINIKGKLYPIVGNICMDMLMLDIGNDNISQGDEVIIFGKNPNLEEFAKYCQTIPYEILTSISRRVKRIFIKE